MNGDAAQLPDGSDSLYVTVTCRGQCGQTISGPDRESVAALLASHAEQDRCPHALNGNVDWVTLDPSAFAHQRSVSASMVRHKRRLFMERR